MRVFSQREPGAGHVISPTVTSNLGWKETENNKAKGELTINTGRLSRKKKNRNLAGMLTMLDNMANNEKNIGN